jgi:hypothetical protein
MQQKTAFGVVSHASNEKPISAHRVTLVVRGTPLWPYQSDERQTWLVAKKVGREIPVPNNVIAVE